MKLSASGLAQLNQTKHLQAPPGNIVSAAQLLQSGGHQAEPVTQLDKLTVDATGEAADNETERHIRQTRPKVSLSTDVPVCSD